MKLCDSNALRRALMGAVAAASWAGPVQAQVQGQEALYVRSLAATCASCHGTSGRTTPGSAVPSVAGMPQEYLTRQLAAFRDGSRPATVMHQLVKGFSQAQIEQIAAHYAAQPK